MTRLERVAGLRVLEWLVHVGFLPPDKEEGGVALEESGSLERSNRSDQTIGSSLEDIDVEARISLQAVALPEGYLWIREAKNATPA